MLELLGHKPAANRARCPATVAALEKVPGVLQAFFSVLDPGKCIPAHDGPYVGYLRYHLGLRVPAENPPQIRVAGQPYTWKEGESVMFDDSWPHAAVGAMAAGFEWFRAMPVTAQKNMEAPAKKLEMPVLALGGEKMFGPMMVPMMQMVAENVTGGANPDCGHWVAEEQPEVLLQHLGRFL